MGEITSGPSAENRFLHPSLKSLLCTQLWKAAKAVEQSAFHHYHQLEPNAENNDEIQNFSYGRKEDMDKNSFNIVFNLPNVLLYKIKLPTFKAQVNNFRR
jgi:hypothetical protein